MIRSLHDKSHAANPRLLRMVLSEVPRYKVFQPRLDTEHDMSSHTFRNVCWLCWSLRPALERENTGALFESGPWLRIGSL